MVPALRQDEVRSATLSMASAIVAAADAAPPLACNIVVTFEPRGGGGQPVAVDVGEAFRSGSVESWRKGPLVSEGRVRIPVPSLAGDFELVCDLACFNDGTPKRADLNFCREKVHVVDHQEETPVPNVAYGVTVADGGRQVFQADIPVHALAQIWHYTIGENQMHVVFDIHALRASGTVIHDPSLGVKEGTVNSFKIRQQGPLEVVKDGSIAAVRDIVQYMGMTGGRTDIGPQTTPVACWLITQQAAIAQYCLWQADGASAIPWHFRDEKTGSYIFVSEYPNLWVGWSGAQGPGLSTNNGWGIDYSHQPDCSYVPWLLTGRRKFLDDLMAQGTQSVNWYNPDYRQRGKGMICQYPNAPQLPAAGARAGVVAAADLSGGRVGTGQGAAERPDDYRRQRQSCWAARCFQGDRRGRTEFLDLGAARDLGAGLHGNVAGRGGCAWLSGRVAGA